MQLFEQKWRSYLKEGIDLRTIEQLADDVWDAMSDEDKKKYIEADERERKIIWDDMQKHIENSFIRDDDRRQRLKRAQNR